jgi:hypothetical protein
MKIIIVSLLMCSIAFAGSWTECLNGDCAGYFDSIEEDTTTGIGTIETSTQTTWGISKTEFIPQKNITTYELAIIVKCFMENDNYCGSPPAEVERHFQETIICAGPEECKQYGYE